MIAQEAKFELLNYKLHGLITEYLVKLHDADGEVVNYHITDYYNEDLNEITSKVLKQKINYDVNVTLDKKYVLYSGDIVDMGIRKLS